MSCIVVNSENIWFSIKVLSYSFTWTYIGKTVFCCFIETPFVSDKWMILDLYQPYVVDVVNVKSWVMFYAGESKTQKLFTLLKSSFFGASYCTFREIKMLSKTVLDIHSLWQPWRNEQNIFNFFSVCPWDEYQWFIHQFLVSVINISLH